MDTLSTLSFVLGSSWLSGLNAYATVGILGLFGWGGCGSQKRTVEDGIINHLKKLLPEIRGIEDHS